MLAAWKARRRVHRAPIAMERADFRMPVCIRDRVPHVHSAWAILSACGGSGNISLKFDLKMRGRIALPAWPRSQVMKVLRATPTFFATSRCKSPSWMRRFRRCSPRVFGTIGKGWGFGAVKVIGTPGKKATRL